MSNPIPPYTRPQPHDGFPRTSEPRAASPTTEERAFELAPTSEAGPPLGASGLDLVEQEVISHYFPDSPNMSMRLYGPNSLERTVNPGAVGTHLDMRG